MHFATAVSHRLTCRWYHVSRHLGQYSIRSPSFHAHNEETARLAFHASLSLGSYAFFVDIEELLGYARLLLQASFLEFRFWFKIISYRVGRDFQQRQYASLLPSSIFKIRGKIGR